MYQRQITTECKVTTPSLYASSFLSPHILPGLIHLPADYVARPTKPFGKRVNELPPRRGHLHKGASLTRIAPFLALSARWIIILRDVDTSDYLHCSYLFQK